jgi:hypothetical protein
MALYFIAISIYYMLSVFWRTGYSSISALYKKNGKSGAIWTKATDNASDLYSEAARFEYRPGHDYRDVGFSWFIWVPPGKFRDSNLNQATTNSFYIVSNLSFSRIESFNAMLSWITNNVIKVPYKEGDRPELKLNDSL